MAKKQKKERKARGGLAAAALADKPKRQKKEKASTGRKNGLGDIMGHSVCAVVRALGQAGVGIKHAEAILATKGITMPPASLSVQLGFGRSGKREPAALTKEQLKELRALAPDPAEQPA